MVVGLERGLNQLGHQVVPHKPGELFDLTIIFNQTSHVRDYVYPQLPTHGPIAFVDCAEYGYYKRLPEVISGYSHAFAAGSMTHDTKNPVQQVRLREHLRGKSFPYFLREFSKHIHYPDDYHPIDYPMYLYSECNIPPNRDEYLRRELDLFVSWGASHPWRMDITMALRDCHTKCEVYVLEENGTPRMPQKQFFGKTLGAKCSVSFDGYGSSSFRLTEVLVRCLLLQGPLSIRRHAPLVDGVHCVEFGIDNNGEEFLATDVCRKLRDSLSDPERSFKIYEAGYHHCWGHYTEKATAQYVLDVVARHDWRKETDLMADREDQSIHPNS